MVLRTVKPFEQVSHKLRHHRRTRSHVYQTLFAENTYASVAVPSGIVGQCLHHHGVRPLKICLFKRI